MTPADADDDDAGPPLPPADIIERTHRLRRVVEEPLRADIIAALLLTRRPTVKVLAQRVGEPADDVARQVRYLRGQGAVEGDFWIPDAVAEGGSVLLVPALARALHSVMRALGAPPDRLLSTSAEQPPGQASAPDHDPSGDDLLRLSYFLLRAQGTGVRDHKTALTSLGEVLSDPGCVEILMALLLTDQASAAEITERVANTEGAEAVGSQITRLADLYVIHPVAGTTDRWTITPPMRRALGGFYDQLVVMRALGGVATSHTDAPRQGDANCN